MISQGTMTRTVSWLRDGTELATKTATDETIVLTPGTAAGAVRVKLPLRGPARRVTLHGSDTEAHAGLGGADFDPEAGSRAALRAEWIGRHPHLHTARQTAAAAAGVAGSLLLVWLLTLIPWPDVDVPWPGIDLPAIPWPDLPAIPWPDLRLPSIPWPDLPDLPAWVDTVRRFLVPIAIAFFIARGEVKRRRRAEEKRAGERRASPQDEVTPGPTP